ncbi:MAG: S8 family serine peptidase [Rhodococcus sp. (in: high G+C Gram-positive bacteria)]
MAPGPCVSVWAPGAEITAARHRTFGSPYGTASGTSFASPIVAGLIARKQQAYVQGTYRPTPATLYDWVRSTSIKNVVQGTATQAHYKCVQRLNNRIVGYTTPTPCATLGGSVYHPSVNNTTAGMVFWKETTDGVCRSRPVSP